MDNKHTQSNFRETLEDFQFNHELTNPELAQLLQTELNTLNLLTADEKDCQAWEGQP